MLLKAHRDQFPASGFSKDSGASSSRSTNDGLDSDAKGNDGYLYAGKRKQLREAKAPRQLKIIQRNSKFKEAFSLPKILNINPRSIYNKIIQLKTYIKKKNIDAVFLSESWERQEEPLTNILDIDGFQVISNPYQRKGIGGKPVLIINTKKFNVINPNQSMISIPWGVEIVWAIITPRQVSNYSKIKRIVLASFYSKPGGKKKTLLLDHIAEVYHFLSARYTDGLYWIMIKIRFRTKNNQFRTKFLAPKPIQFRTKFSFNFAPNFIQFRTKFCE